METHIQTHTERQRWYLRATLKNKGQAFMASPSTKVIYIKGLTSS